MSVFVEDMDHTPSVSVVEFHLENGTGAPVDESVHTPAPGTPRPTQTHLSEFEDSDEEDDDDDAATVVHSPTSDTMSKKSADELKAEDLRSSRIGTTLHDVFDVDRQVSLDDPPRKRRSGSPSSLSFHDPTPSPTATVVDLDLTLEDLRISRLPKKLDGLFGLAATHKAVHFADSPARMYEYDDDGSTLAGNDGHSSYPRSAFSMSPSTPRQPADDGNLVQWTTVDPENPHSWSRMYKWTMTLVIGFMTLNATFASSAPSAAIPTIARDFGVSVEAAELTTSIFLIGYIFGPSFWGPGSEILGRRLVLIVTMFCFTVANIGQGLAPNFGVFLGTRFLAGFFAVAPLVNGGGVIADIWDPTTRGLATTVFSTMIFFGPVLGAIVGGTIIPSSLGWRWVFWAILIFAACSTLLAIFVLPETHAPTLQAQKARRLRTLLPHVYSKTYASSERVQWTPRMLFERTLLRPFKMLVVEPILLLVTIYVAIVYGCLYSLFSSLPIIFGEIHGFTITQTGLVFLFVGSGAVFATLVDVYYIRKYPALLVQWRGSPPPEKRLYGAMIAGPTFAAAIFWLGWTGYTASIPWYVPALATTLMGFSVSLVFNSFMAYLVDTYLMNTASAFASLTIIRSTVGAAFPLFISTMIRALGVNISSTIIGAVAVVLAPLPFIFFKYGSRIRSRSDFAPCLDLKVAEEIEAERHAAALAGKQV